jgi:hypothetical protein
MASDPDRFLLQRGKRWYYQRRVPSQFSHIDDRRFAKVSLKTGSLEVARLRRSLAGPRPSTPMTLLELPCRPPAMAIGANLALL